MFCALCQTSIDLAEPVSSCPECAAVFHRECHEENGGCGTYGCGQVPANQAQVRPGLPPAVWGRERKECPYCRKQIRAAAVRCRHCGTRFVTDEPLTQEQFQEMSTRRTRISHLKKITIAAFICGLIPVLAPIGLVASPILFYGNRDLMSKVPALHRMLGWLGLGLSGLWVLVLTMVMILS